MSARFDAYKQAQHYKEREAKKAELEETQYQDRTKRKTKKIKLYFYQEVALKQILESKRVVMRFPRTKKDGK